MQEVNFDEVLDLILGRNPRYARDAYHFLREALDFTQKQISKENKGKVRHVAGQELLDHVTGQELLDGIRQHALQQFGPMTVTVFEEWGIRNCKDFGEMVFYMVESGLLAKTEKDSRTDFHEGYDFTEAFEKPFWPESRLKAEAKKAVKPAR
jgi:uncharacterized repeat protein (TIGR04138 family)